MRVSTHATERAFASALMALTVSGCSSWQGMHVNPGLPGAQPTNWGEVRIRATSGEEATLHAWTLTGDTLRGTDRAMKYRAFALNDISLQHAILGGDSLGTLLRSTPKLPAKLLVHLRDGTKVELIEARVVADTLRARLVTHPGSVPAFPEVAYALSDVWSMETRQSDPMRTLGLIVGVLALTFAALGAIALSEGGIGD